MTGQIQATSGNGFINEFDVNKDLSNARRSLSFYPQYDYLPEYMTVEQSLKLFPNLRGLESNFISSKVNDMIKVFKLEEFSNEIVQNLK